MAFQKDMDRGDRDRDDRGDDDKRGRAGTGLGLKRGSSRRKMCRFCGDDAPPVDYKEMNLLKYFVTDRGRVVPRRISGNCAKHQRSLTLAIKRARMVALLPFTVTGK